MQPGLHRKTLSQKNKNQPNKKLPGRRTGAEPEEGKRADMWKMVGFAGEAQGKALVQSR
jgi:hypothetical protein